jgi:CheY-like chemotaxis protein
MARKLILLVEDHTDSRLILATVLKRAGYDVCEAEDGEAALACIETAQPALILLDIALPAADGWSVASLVRSAFSPSEIPIVAVTAFDGAENRLRAQRLGFNGYFAKPVEPFAVVAFVQSLIGPGERRNGERRKLTERRVRHQPVAIERRKTGERRMQHRRASA